MIVLTALGVFVVGVVYIDALTTTLAPQAGAGPVTRRLTGLVWRSVLRFQRSTGARVVTRRAGPVILVGTVMHWVVLLWLGWSLIFLGHENSVRNTATGETAGGTDVVYFVGFNLFTLGVGDFVATSPGWRLAAVVASFSGLFLITLSITYLLSVVSAVVARRALAAQIGSIGRSPEDIVSRAWDGRRFTDASIQQLAVLASPLALTTEHHLAFPVLEHFSAPEVTTSAPVCVARLDEAMRLIDTGVGADHRPHESALAPVRAILDRYLDVVSRNAVDDDGAKAPPPPDLDRLRAAGVPVVDDRTYVRALDSHAATRSAWRRHVRTAGWDWAGVSGGRTPEKL
jgi:hypothetical protein